MRVLRRICNKANFINLSLKQRQKVWSFLVPVCKANARLKVVKMLRRRLIETEPKIAETYTMFSTVNAELKNWVGVEEVRRVMRLRGLQKRFGFGRIE